MPVSNLWAFLSFQDVAHATEESQELRPSLQMASCAQQLFFFVDLCSNKALRA